MTDVRGIGPLSLLCLSLACCSAAPAEDRFARDMAQRFRDAKPGVSVTIDPRDALTLRVTMPGREPMTVMLDHLRHVCSHSTPADCASTKTEFVENTLALPPKPQFNRSQLRVVIRGKDYVDYVKSTMAGERLPVMHPVGEDLFAIVAAVTAKTTVLMSPARLRDLGLNPAEGWTLALRQTRATLPKLPTVAALRNAPIVFEHWPLAAALLIDLPGWARLSAAIGPDLFVTVVADDYVFVATKPDGVDFDGFKAAVVEDCEQQSRCVSPNVYRFRNGMWRIAR